MHLKEFFTILFMIQICTPFVTLTIASRDEIRKSSLTAHFFHGMHVRSPQHSWYEYDNDDGDDEDDYKPLDPSASDDDEGQINSTVRHSSEQQTGYDSDEDDRDNRHRNNFLIHRARKPHTKNEQRFVWHPFTPSFLINFGPYSPVNPLVMSKWSRKPNDILLVVLQQQPPSSFSTAPCTCESQNETSTSTPTSSDDLRRERNESSSSAANVDEPHLTADWPSSCIWAIVSCCSPNNYHFRYGCFTYLGCTIAFWDTEPCQLPTMIEASRQAHSYYTKFAHGSTEKPHPDTEKYPGNEESFRNTTNVSTSSTPSPVTTTINATVPSTTTTTTTTVATPTTSAPVTTTTDTTTEQTITTY